MSNAPTITKKIWRFGQYELDPLVARLTKQGIAIKLQEQPLRILSILLERAGDIVSREELRKELWPEGTFVEFDGSLNTALMKLRAALNDDPDNPRFIETVPRKGYRFIAPVHVLGLSSAEETVTPALNGGSSAPAPEIATANQADSSLAFPRRYPARLAGQRWVWATVAVATLAALVAGVIWRVWPHPEPRVLRVTQLTHTGKVQPNSKIITDGTRVYFTAEEDGRLRLMQSSIHGGSAEFVTTPFEATVVLDISPDHQQFVIGPAARSGEPMPLWLWPAHGGAPHRLGDVSAQEAAWSPAGNLIAFTRGDKLFTVRPDGSGIREIGDFSAVPHSLVWSPDAKSLRFTETDPSKAGDEIWTISSEGRALHLVFSDGAQHLHEASGSWDAGYFFFTAGSDSYMNRAVDTASNVWTVRTRRRLLAARPPGPVELTHGPVSFTKVAALPGGNRIFALGSHPQYQLMRFDPASGNATRILEDAGTSQVDYSPDGQWLVYSLRQNGTLWKSARDGTRRLELTSTSPGAYAPSWSPDGKEILFTAFLLGNQPQLYLVSSGGGVPRPIVSAAALGTTLSGDWSPDGTHIVMDYAERHGDSAPRLQVLDLRTGAVQRLPGTEGLTQPRWSPDGRHLAAVEQRTHRILLGDERGKVWTFLAEVQDPSSLYWSADGKALYFQDSGDAQKTVYRIQIKSRAKKEILGFGPWLTNGAAQCHFTGVGPDGSIYATIDHGGTDLYAIDLSLP